MCGDEVDDDTEPRPARELEPGFGLVLHLGERIAAREQVRDEVVLAKDRIGEIAGLLRRVEGAPHERTARPDMPRPSIYLVEEQIDAGLEAVHSTLLHQVKPELAKAIRRLVVAEARPQHRSDQGVSGTGRVAVAVLAG